MQRISPQNTRWFASLCAGALWLWCGCNSNDDFVEPLEFEWTFDYSDFTSSAPEQLRDCDNDVNTDITFVRIQATDPQGQRQGFDITFSCADGIDTPTQVRDIEGGVFDLDVTAGASNDVLYRSLEEGAQLAPGVPTSVTLRAAVGELQLDPQIEGSVDCATDVGQIRLELFPVRAGVPDATPSTTRVFDDPCNGSEYKELSVFDLPAIPEEGDQGISLARYLIRGEVSDPSDVRVGCVELERNVAPGPAAGVTTTPFNLATCP